MSKAAPPAVPPDSGDTEPLLHNMSVPPRSVIQYQGLDDLVVSNGFGGTGIGSYAYAPRARRNTVYAVQLPEAVQSAAPEALLAALGASPASDAERTLIALIEERARSLPLPDACALTHRARENVVPVEDTLTALAILSKCSSRLWLRAKYPSLEAALERRSACLLVPAHWSAAVEAGSAP